MPVEILSYGALAERLNISPEASRALVRRLRLPRQRGNDGKARVTVDLAEITHKPMPARSPGGHRPDTLQSKAQAAALNAKITELEDEIAQVEIAATGHRADFERERDRADHLMAVLLRQTADLMKAKETAARFEGEIATLRSRSLWRRLAG
jgi:hypothetical protein